LEVVDRGDVGCGGLKGRDGGEIFDVILDIVDDRGVGDPEGLDPFPHVEKLFSWPFVFEIVDACGAEVV
jgi:hypothetical protein